MTSKALKQFSRLEDLPNIGNHIADDLRAIGIHSPGDLRGQVPLTVFNDLKETMGHRHDPCVFYTLLSVEHFFATSESLPWWRFTTAGKTQLTTQRTKQESTQRRVPAKEGGYPHPLRPLLPSVQEPWRTATRGCI